MCAYICRSDRLLKEVTICLVGKYTKNPDAYASVIKSLDHAAMACNHKLDLRVGFLHVCNSIYSMERPRIYQVLH